MSVCNVRGHTLRCRSGTSLDLTQPKAEDFKFSDIAGGLSKICRFGAQSNKFYSVAEHCYHCCRYAETRLPREREFHIAALMHDAAEAFLGDCVKPLKVLLPDYQRLEQQMELCISMKYRLMMGSWHQMVKEADLRIYVTKRKALFGYDSSMNELAVRYPSIEGVELMCLSPINAEALFTRKAKSLGLDVTI